jgi:hypothetical protein
VKATRRRDGSLALDRAVPVGGEVQPVRRSFVVMVSEDERGRLGGVVEAVRTGRKERFQGLETLGPVIEAMFWRLRGEGREESRDTR